MLFYYAAPAVGKSLLPFFRSGGGGGHILRGGGGPVVDPAAMH